MNLLAPLWLGLAAAAAVPLLLHLMRRRIGTRVEFPAVEWLARAQREHSRTLQLKNLLLMCLRVAAIVLAALAAARPVARVPGAGHPPTALAIVLDNSLSTTQAAGGAPVLDGLVAAARDAVRRAGGDDRVWLVTADGAVAGRTGPAVTDALRRVRPIAGAGNLPAAFARATALATSAGLPGAAVLVLTDGQAVAWEGARPAPAGATVRVVVPPGEAAANRAVVHAEAAPARWAPRGTVRATVRGGDSLEFRVTLAGRTLVRGTAAGGTVEVRAAPPERGWLAGAVAIPPDELRGDDVRHFAVYVGDAPRVTVDPSAGGFVRDALATLAADGRVSIGGETTIASAEAVRARPALVGAPEDPVRLGAANRALAAAGIPWRFGEERAGPAAARGEGLPPITVQRRWRLVAPPGTLAETLATVNGEPWIVAGEGYVLVGSPFTEAGSDLVVRAAFPPWLDRQLAQRLGREQAVFTSAVPGAPVRAPAGATALVGEDTSAVAVPVTGGRIAAPAVPGVYRWRAGDRTIGALVVNPEPAESDLARAPADTLAAWLGGAVGTDAGAAIAAAYASGAGRPLAGALLAGVVLVVLLETLLTRVRRGDAG